MNEALLLSKIDELSEVVQRAMEKQSAVQMPSGLLGYEGLQERLAIDGRKPCLRTVKHLAVRYRSILRPVKLGHRLVGFRQTSVDALIAHLAGDEKIGALRL